MRFFYHPNIDSNIISVPEEESKHMVRVLRLKVGEDVIFVDGVGGRFIAEIIEAHPKRVTAKIKDKQENWEQRNLRLHLAVAPTKNIDRFEWFLEKATEIGIDEITPIISSNSERKIIKPERLEKVIVSAVKQSQKAYKPILNPIVSFSEFVKKEMDSTKTIAHCYNLSKIELKEIKPAKKLTILIGPEGDFTIPEIESALNNGFTAISLGKSRLRTETAGIIACHTANLLF